MDGTEPKSDVQRAELYDVLFRRGPQSVKDLSVQTDIGGKVVTRLVDHEWFVMMNGFVYIAMVDRTRKVVARVFY